VARPSTLALSPLVAPPPRHSPSRPSTSPRPYPISKTHS
jgi:hypothetical protein